MRRLTFIFGWFLAGAIIALGALPWWLPVALRVVAHRYGAEFSRYEPIGYARFAVYEVVVEQPKVTIRAGRAESETPVAWLFHRCIGRPATIGVSTWSVVVKPSPAHAAQGSPGGAMRTRAILFKVAAELERWAPHTGIGAGKVTWPGGGLEINAASWQGRTLAVKKFAWGRIASDVVATFTASGEIELTAAPGENGLGRVALKNTARQISGEFVLFEQVVKVTAELPDLGWVPVAAELTAAHWKIPAQQVSLGATYETITGDARIAWQDGKFDATANVAGNPATGNKAPRLAAKFHALGDADSITVDMLDGEVAGTVAKLSAPVSLDHQGRSTSGAAHLSIETDLAKQPWWPSAAGRVSGRIDWIPAGKDFSKVAATLNARDVKVGPWSVANASTTLALDWPRLEVKNVVLGFAEGDTLVARGSVDLAAKTVLESSVEGSVRPSVLTPWLPAGFSFDTLAVAAKATGPFDQLEHSGHATLTNLRGARVRPSTIDAAWHGRGVAIEVPAAEISAGDSRLKLSGSLDHDHASLSRFALEAGGVERLKLSQPVAAGWREPFQIGEVRLGGENSTVVFSGAFGGTGNFKAHVVNFRSEWLADFLVMPKLTWRAVALDANGAWRAGPLTWSTRGEFEVVVATDRIATVAVDASGNAKGTQLEMLRVAEGPAVIVTARGELPLTVYPGAAELIHFDASAPLTLTGSTTPNPDFWKTLAESTGFQLEEPEVSVAMSGTWSEPKGEINAKAARLSVDAKRIKFPIPTIENLELRLSASRQSIRLDRFSAQVERQVVNLSGELPLHGGQWSRLQESPATFLRRNGSWHLEIPNAEVAAIARFFPAVLAPAGRLKIDATMSRGGDLSGSFELHDAATRPLGPLGVLQSLQAEVQLSGRTVEIKTLTAQAGGQPVTLTGKVELPADGVPTYDLNLRGENLPLVRQTGLLLRADVDLKLMTPASGPTTISGNVKFRESMFLSDIRAFIPKGTTSDPLRRPPFFAVTIPPVDAWGLAVEVRGDKFLRLRTPLFTGLASAHFRIGGTLGEPRATGEARIDSGQVLLPFANFRVDQGTVRLTEADPYSLRLYMSGTSRRYGYDLRMEMTGTAAEPIVTFTSSPPLETSQVLLMVTAGEVPQDEISYGSNQRAARLGTYLGQSLLNDFGGESTEPDRLSISTGERVSRQGRETYDIEYRLNHRYTLVGEYDEFDDYNAGVKLRLFSSQDETAKPNTAPSKPLEGTGTNK
ncbi:MAG: hypothetical protein JWM32_430 [Verrucomicrobia bacterium]|nr:hypothetical protein [Verrucomicrobiota bacterium]